MDSGTNFKHYSTVAEHSTVQLRGQKRGELTAKTIGLSVTSMRAGYKKHALCIMMKFSAEQQPLVDQLRKCCNTTHLEFQKVICKRSQIILLNVQ